MDSSRTGVAAKAASHHSPCTRGAIIMSKLTIAVDLAKNVFEIAVAKPSGKIIERKRLTRPQFERFWQTKEPCSVVMEACGSAHHWARQLIARGFEVRLLPAHYVKPYRGRNKTDRAEAGSRRCLRLPTARRCSKPPVLRASKQWRRRARTSRRSWLCTASENSGRARAPRGSTACAGSSGNSAFSARSGQTSFSLACPRCWSSTESICRSGCGVWCSPSGRKHRISKSG